MRKFMNKKLASIITFISLLLFSFSIQADTKLSQEKIERLDEMMKTALEKFHVPGAAVGVIVDGNIILTKGYGTRDLLNSLPTTENTQFAIGSCSKAFTTFVLGELVDKKLISWDDPVIKHLPEFHLKDLHATHHITIRDLVTHRSGLPRHDLLWYGSKLSRIELLSKLQHLEPTADLREKFQYNNLMYMVAGLVIEKVTGKSWEQVVQEGILTPLSMNNSNFSVDVMQTSEDFSLPYREKDGQIVLVPFKNISAIGPAGSINASVADMAQWLQLQLSDGQGLVLKQTLDAMHTTQMAMNFPGLHDSIHEDTLLLGYGLGWMIGLHKGSYVVTHGGGIDGFISNIVLFPKEKVGVVVLTNTDSFSLAEISSYAIADLVMDKENSSWLTKAEETLEKLRSFDADQSTITTVATNSSLIRSADEYVGEFEHPGYGIITVSLDDTGNLSSLYNGHIYTLEHKCYDHFSACISRDIPLKTPSFFVGNDLGTITEFHIALESTLPPITFHKKPSNTWNNESHLRKFTGVFEGNAGLLLKVSLEEGHLFASVEGQSPYKLAPSSELSFSIEGLPGYTLHFSSDAEEKISDVKLAQPYGTFQLKVVTES
jgi:CubicO group peptidase (beta-lactamase class C family)